MAATSTAPWTGGAITSSRPAATAADSTASAAPSDFAWGPYDEVYVQQSMAIDNAGYLPDGTQYQEFLYAGISREYNRFTARPPAAADGGGRLLGQRGHVASGSEISSTSSAGGPPRAGRLLSAPSSQLKQLIQDDPAVHEDWRLFTRDAYMGWGQQFMAGLPPHSINNSQGESEQLSVRPSARRSAGVSQRAARPTTAAMLQPANLLRRGELPFAAVPRHRSRPAWWRTITGTTTAALADA